MDEQVRNTIDYLNENNINELYPCHCTSFEVGAEMYKSLAVKEVGVGLELIW